MRIPTSREEIKHIARAWAALTIAFTILILSNITSVKTAVLTFLTSGLIIGFAVILHEMAHKAVAQHYGLFAEFRSDGKMLIVAIATAFFGIILFAPGGVMISGHAGTNRIGKIGMAGPLTNLILAALFFALTFVIGDTLLIRLGFMVNSWFALFNMIPFGFFDGAKVLRWNKKIYAVMLISSIILLII